MTNLGHLKMFPIDFPCLKTWGWTLESSLQNKFTVEGGGAPPSPAHFFGHKWPILATQVSLGCLKTVPMDFPCPKTWGWTLESSLQPSPNRNYILQPFWGFYGRNLSFFFNFL